MYILYDFGFTDKDVDIILDSAPEVNELDDLDISEKLSILEALDCEQTEVIEIVTNNPEYLLSDSAEIAKLINKLMEIGIENVGEVILNSPHILNSFDYEIDEFIDEKYNCGYDMDEIKEMICEGKIQNNF